MREREKARVRKRGRERCQLFCPHPGIVGVYGPRDRPAEFAASAENLNPSEPGKKKRPTISACATRNSRREIVHNRPWLAADRSRDRARECEIRVRSPSPLAFTRFSQAGEKEGRGEARNPAARKIALFPLSCSLFVPGGRGKRRPISS